MAAPTLMPTATLERPAGAPAVLVEQVTRRFGEVEALRGVSFAVECGEIFGLLGPNGAGKTTLIRILLSLLRPTSGTARVLGVDVAVDPRRVRGLVGWVPQRTAVDPMLTARENLILMAGMHHLRRHEAAGRIDHLLELVELVEAADRVVENYSGGMRKRLDLAMGLIHRPHVLFLDEPTLGLDIQTRRRLWSYIASIRDQGTTVLLTTHYLEEADSLCDRIAIIDGGLIRALDTPEGLKTRFGGESLRLDLASEVAPETIEALAEALGRIDGVLEIQRERDGFRLAVRDHVAVLRPVLDTAERAGVPLRGLLPSRATMDDVFLAITGYSLREEEGEQG